MGVQDRTPVAANDRRAGGAADQRVTEPGRALARILGVVAQEMSRHGGRRRRRGEGRRRRRVQRDLHRRPTGLPATLLRICTAVKEYTPSPSAARLFVVMSIVVPLAVP